MNANRMEMGVKRGETGQCGGGDVLDTPRRWNGLSQKAAPKEMKQRAGHYGLPQGESRVGWRAGNKSREYF